MMVRQRLSVVFGRIAFKRSSFACNRLRQLALPIVELKENVRYVGFWRLIERDSVKGTGRTENRTRTEPQRLESMVFRENGVNMGNLATLGSQKPPLQRGSNPSGGGGVPLVGGG